MIDLCIAAAFHLLCILVTRVAEWSSLHRVNFVAVCIERDHSTLHTEDTLCHSICVPAIQINRFSLNFNSKSPVRILRS